MEHQTSLRPAEDLGRIRASDEAAYREVLARYERSDLWKGLVHLGISLIGFGVFWYASYRSLEVSCGLALGLSVPTAAFLVRLFIILHDCAHESYFKSRAANRAVGRFLGVLTFTPFRYWQRHHAKHHATSSMLDRRSEVDIPTLTVDEYVGLSRWSRLKYRVLRNPLFLFGLAPLLHFVVVQRLPWIVPASWREERRSILWTNVALVAGGIGLSWLLGARELLLIELPVMWIGSSVGLWIFYVHHQFEETSWVRDAEWTFEQAGMRGASYYKLPSFLEWFTLNIGIHHIHHLSTRIPGYHLHRCLEESAELREVTTLTLWKSLRCLATRLWDEKRRRMVGFSEVGARLS